MIKQYRSKPIIIVTLLINLASGLMVANFASSNFASSTEALIEARGEGELANVSAASYLDTGLSAESIVAAFGANLATTTQSADQTPLPTELAGTRVLVIDSLGEERFAPLFFVSPFQVNYLMPSGTANGTATIRITSGDGSISTGTVQVDTVAPGLFAADSTGKGPAAALTLRVKADGGQYFEPVAFYSDAEQKVLLAPIDFGPDTGETSDQVFLVLYGTGLRFRSSLSSVTAKVGGIDSQVVFAGSQEGFVGLDQVNVRLPGALAGRGEVDVELAIDGKQANPLRIAIAERSEYAYFRFDVPPFRDTFVIQLIDPQNIAHARALLSGRKQNPSQVMGIIIKEPAPYNAPWSYHLDPPSISFFDTTTEVCSGAIAYVEEHLDKVGTDFLPNNVWCPWASRLISEVPRSVAEPAPSLR